MRDGCSIVACCMDRNQNLVKALPSWLNSGVEQIVIVDWHSKESVETTLLREIGADHPHWKTLVQIVRVELLPAQRRWVLSWAYNLGVRYAKQPWLLKLDCDNLLNTGFINSVIPDGATADWSDKYWRGDWRKATTRQQVYLNGVLLVARAHFVAIGGYSEWIQSYGWEDSAAHQSLENKLGLQPISLEPNLIQHLQHDDELRVGRGRNTFTEIHRNRFLDASLPWTLTSPRCKYGPTADGKCLQLLSFPVVPAEHLERAQHELDHFIAIKVAQPVDPRPKNTPGKALLYVLVRNGLGNKMRALASAYTLFDGLNQSKLYNPFKHNWHLVIVWSQDNHCEASVSDLFDLSSLAQEYPSQISVVRNLPTIMPTPLLELTDTNVFDEYKSDSSIVLSNVNSLLEMVAQKAASEESINVLLESASVIESPFRSWQNECKFLRALRLSKAAQALVDRNEARVVRESGVPLSEMVAVHVRCGQQEAAYDDVSKWSADKQIQWKMWRSRSSIKTFTAQMLAMRDKQPELKFYIASDSAHVFQEMSKSFPPHVLFEQERTVFDRSIQQVQSAIADVVLVSKCKLLLGSQWSSFTELCRRWTEVQMQLAGIAF